MRKDEESLSVNWLEYLKCPSRDEEISKLRITYSQKLNTKLNAKIAVLNVGEVLKKVLAESLNRRNVEILHNPSANDTSHSGIYNLKPDNEVIAELILETVR